MALRTERPTALGGETRRPVPRVSFGQIHQEHRVEHRPYERSEESVLFPLLLRALSRNCLSNAYSPTKFVLCYQRPGAFVRTVHDDAGVLLPAMRKQREDLAEPDRYAVALRYPNVPHGDPSREFRFNPIHGLHDCLPLRCVLRGRRQQSGRAECQIYRGAHLKSEMPEWLSGLTARLSSILCVSMVREETEEEDAEQEVDDEESLSSEGISLLDEDDADYILQRQEAQKKQEGVSRPTELMKL